MAIAFDAKSNSGRKAGLSTYSFNHATGTLTNGILIVVIFVGDSSDTTTVTGVTYNSVALTQAVTKRSPQAGYTERTDIWYLVNPTAGTNAVAVTFSESAVESVATAVTFSNVSQSSPVNNTASGTNNSGTPSTNITTTADGCMLVEISYTRYDGTGTVGAGQTELYQTDSGDGYTVSSYKLAGAAGVQNMAWTINSEVWVQAVVALQEPVSFVPKVIFF